MLHMLQQLALVSCLTTVAATSVWTAFSDALNRHLGPSWRKPSSATTASSNRGNQRYISSWRKLVELKMAFHAAPDAAPPPPRQCSNTWCCGPTGMRRQGHSIAHSIHLVRHAQPLD